MAQVRRSNPSAFATINAHLKELDGKQARAGWFENAKYENGVSVAQVAMWQEFGTGKIPPRPFMRVAVAENTKKWRELMASGAKAILKGTRTLDDVMNMIGTEAENDIARAIEAVTSPPLSPITIELRAMRRKGIVITGRTVGEAAEKIKSEGYTPPNVSAKPLIDSALLFSSVSHIVEKSS